MRISRVQASSSKDNQNSTITAKNNTGFRPTIRSEFYIRPHHISRKPKSPFRKYESCVSESFKTTKLFKSCNSDIQMTKEFDDLTTNCANKVPQTPNWLLTNEFGTKSVIKNEERIVKIEIVNNKSQISRETNHSLCSKCNSRPEYDNKNVHFDGPEKSKLNKIELSPKTAEQFMDILIAEDVILRKKIADGQVDDKVLKGLERIADLRQKYMKYKDDEKIKNKKDENKHLFSYKPIMFRHKSAVSLSDPAFSQELKRHPLVKF